MRAKLIASALVLIVAAPAGAEDWDFVLVNKTGKTIKLVEVSPSGSGQWVKETVAEDIMSDIGPGIDHTVHFTKDESACAFDVRLTFADGTAQVWPGLDVCDYAFADFSYANGAPVLRGS